MGRKKQNSDNSLKRQCILKVAEELFLSKGYSSVSMDAIAEAAPVSKPTLYNHFKDKKALFTAIMQGKCKYLFGELESGVYTNQSLEKIFTMIAGKFHDLVFSPDAINMHRITIAEAVKFPEIGKLFYESGPERSIRMLADYLKKLDAEKKLKVNNPELSAIFFLSMIKGYNHMQCIWGLKKTISSQEKNQIIQHAVKIFLDSHKI